MSRRALLWSAFALVHALVAWLGTALPNQPMGDVYLVYQPWSFDALNGGPIVGITEPWVYPPVALVPMAIAQLMSSVMAYPFAWVLVITAADAAAFALLVGAGRSNGRVWAAGFWLAAILLLGPVGLYRLDGLTTPIAVAGLLWLVGRPWTASVLLAVATWIKVWPAALLAAAVIAVRRRAPIVGGAAFTSAAVLAVVLLAGGGTHLFGFVTDQTGRGLQVEAPVSTLFLWRAALGAPGTSVYYDLDILTYQVTGPGVDAAIAVMTPLLVVVVLAIAVLGAVQSWRGARFAALFPPLALALVVALVAFNKVASPQYLSWIVAPLVLGILLARRTWRWPAVLALATTALTQLIYPLTYDRLIMVDPLIVGVLTLRNALLFALLAWAIVLVVRARPSRARTALAESIGALS